MPPGVDKRNLFLYNRGEYSAGSSNGRTADSGSVCEGSIPSPAASYMPRWSSGLGRRPLTAEIRGSNPLRGTQEVPLERKFGGFCMYRECEMCGAARLNALLLRFARSGVVSFIQKICVLPSASIHVLQLWSSANVLPFTHLIRFIYLSRLCRFLFPCGFEFLWFKRTIRLFRQRRQHLSAISVYHERFPIWP